MEQRNLGGNSGHSIHKMTKVINFFGGPCCGKTGMSGQLFGLMKSKNINVAYVSEFATDLVWKNSLQCLDDQLYIFGEQNHRIYTLLNQVNYIITDCPILLSVHYLRTAYKKFNNESDNVITWKDSIEDLIYETFMLYNNINFQLERNTSKPYIQSGRFHTETQAKAIDSELNLLLDFYKIKRHKVNTFDQIKDIMTCLESSFAG